MRSTLQLLALASAAIAAPQGIDFAAIDDAAQPSTTGPAPGATEQTVNLDVNAAIAQASAAAQNNPLIGRSVTKRTLGVNDPCGVQPDGTIVKDIVDSVAAFLAFPFYATAATTAAVPSGYTKAFTNLKGSVNGNVYMGLTTLSAYDPAQCAALCNAKEGCQGFNIFFERDPTLNPAPACPNPAGFTNAKCTLWGAGVTPEMALNTGQMRESFQVVITGSNGYNKYSGPPPCPHFTGPVKLNGAINAPLKNGVDTYIGVKFFPTAYLPSLCAAACEATTAYDRRHAKNGEYKPCNFFAAYIMSKNGQAQGLYCALYTTPWDPSYATNTGQTRGKDVYTISSAYSYSLDPQDSGKIDGGKDNNGKGNDGKDSNEKGNDGNDNNGKGNDGKDNNGKGNDGKDNNGNNDDKGNNGKGNDDKNDNDH